MAMGSSSKRFFLELLGCTVSQRDNTQRNTETNGTICEVALPSSSKRFFSKWPGCTVFQRDKTHIKTETNGAKCEMALG